MRPQWSHIVQFLIASVLVQTATDILGYGQVARCLWLALFGWLHFELVGPWFYFPDED